MYLLYPAIQHCSCRYGQIRPAPVLSECHLHTHVLQRIIFRSDNVTEPSEEIIMTFMVWQYLGHFER
jgi:hypothetical protein